MTASATPVVFLHVPKTGGTGVQVQLDDWFGDPAPRHAYQWWRSDVVPSASGGMVGHFPYDLLAGRAPADAAWVTIIRDPLERSISHWWHYARIPDDSPWPAAFRAGVTLDRWCTDPMFACDASDAQVRYLAWLPEADRQAVLAGRPVTPVPDDAVALAIDRLEQFAWVGVTERHHEGLQALSYTLHQPPPPRRAPLNESEGRPCGADLSPELRQALAERNRGDTAVHIAALRLFQDRYGAMVDDLLGNRTADPAPSSFELDLTGPLHDRAWHALERAGSRPFRWVGGRVTVDALVDRSVPRWLEVEVVSWVDELALDAARLAVDGVAVPLEKVENGTVRLRAPVDSRPAFWVQRTRIDIEPGNVSSVPGDPRRLGLAVAGVRIN